MVPQALHVPFRSSSLSSDASMGIIRRKGLTPEQKVDGWAALILPADVRIPRSRLLDPFHDLWQVHRVVV